MQSQFFSMWICKGRGTPSLATHPQEQPQHQDQNQEQQQNQNQEQQQNQNQEQQQNQNQEQQQNQGRLHRELDRSALWFSNQSSRPICRRNSMPIGGHINHSTLKKSHARALKMSGVRPFVLYSLRHSFATRIAPHVDAWTLCKIMGWASLSVAMRYIHPSNERVLEAISVMGGHNSGHSENFKKLSALSDTPETTERIVG